MIRWSLSLALVGLVASAWGRPQTGAEAFAQLRERLPTPDEVRLASGAPGPRYWQQRADYRIDATLRDGEQPTIEGRARITYTNNSPHLLDYLWMQLDQNILRRDSIAWLADMAPGFQKFGYRMLARLLAMEDFEGGFHIEAVRLGGDPVPHTVVGTMMRIDPPQPIGAGDRVVLEIEWRHAVVNAGVIWSRGGYEILEDARKNKIFTIAQWYPRMAAYTDYAGWQHKQFVGRGEFTLELGDFDVALTVPADHVVAATGTLQNPGAVLTSTRRARLEQARRSDTPAFIITRAEAEAASAAEPTTKTRTWRYRAKDVRDFAFASSRTFLWDAMGVKLGDRRPLAMSYYPPVAEPLWARYSSQAIAHTLEVYSRMTFDYPYPVAISVNGPVGGMEYPMISFNGPRAEEDGTYYDKWAEGRDWRYTKYGLISVVIHEVGHNWFPMIVNSDERQWTWMDEGLNSFVQFVAEQEWEDEYPSWRGHPKKIVDFMKSTRQVPIMTNSESILNFGNNAYGKPATALNILRETILGRELFDFAFKTYARRWRFKRPEPADFFRTMEDASGVDLDWFWRGWFYTTDPVDIALAGIEEYTLDTRNPSVEKARDRRKEEETYVSITRERSKDLPKRLNRFPELKDFYDSYDPHEVTRKDREAYEKLLEELDPDERALLTTARRFYVVHFENEGGLVMPIILRITYEDGARELQRIPAEIWRRDPQKVSRLLITKKAITRLEIDPFLETADIDVTNNAWPRVPEQTRFQLFKKARKPNAMQEAREAEEKAKGGAEADKPKGDGGKEASAAPTSAAPASAAPPPAAPVSAAPTSAAPASAP